jgi:hypothetical protein
MMMMIADLLAHFVHHLFKLFKINLTIFVFVYSFDQFIPCFIIEVTEDLSEVIHADVTTTIRVEELESLP